MQIFWFWPPVHLSRINPQDSTKSLPSNANRVGCQPLATDKDLANPNGDVILQVFCKDHWEIVPETFWKSVHYDMALEVLMNGSNTMLTPDVLGRARFALVRSTATTLFLALRGKSFLCPGSRQHFVNPLPYALIEPSVQSYIVGNGLN